MKWEKVTETQRSALKITIEYDDNEMVYLEGVESDNWLQDIHRVMAGNKVSFKKYERLWKKGIVKNEVTENLVRKKVTRKKVTRKKVTRKKQLKGSVDKVKKLLPVKETRKNNKKPIPDIW